MKKMSEPIVFFGSGPVAAESLRLLVRDFVIEAVITKPKPAGHRGDFPVLSLAEKLKLKTFTPTNKRELSGLFQARPLLSRLGVVIDYGIIIAPDVIDYFPLGIVNSHFSLLPKLRGADPITFAILHGDSETGVSLMLIDEKMDEGPLLAQSPYALPKDVTAPELTQRLIEISHETLKAILPTYVEGTVSPLPQTTSIEPTYSRKLTKQDGIIDWRKPAVQIEREIRAFIEWPKSRAEIANKAIIITKAHVEYGNGIPGEIWNQGKSFGVYCSQDILVIDRLKPAGKAEMTASSFLAGYSVI